MNSILWTVYSYNDPSTEVGPFHKVKARLKLAVKSYSKVNGQEAEKKKGQCERVSLPLMWASKVAVLPSSTTTLCNGCVNVGAWVVIFLGTLKRKRKEIRRSQLRAILELLWRWQTHIFQMGCFSDYLWAQSDGQAFSFVAWIWPLG